MVYTGRWFATILLAVMISGCVATSPSHPRGGAAKTSQPLPLGLDPTTLPDPFASTYQTPASSPFAIVNATILTAAGPKIIGGTIVVKDGRIAAIGSSNVAVPAGIRIINANGRYVTPGIIDPHSHIGAESSPGEASGDRSNESVNPAGIWVENSVWAQDPIFGRVIAAGVTTMQILPGSGQPFNGRSVILRNVPSIDVKGMKFPGVPGAIKMACGENPASGENGSSGSRAGVMRDFRTMFINAADYAHRWQIWRERGAGEPPKRDLALENVAGALTGELRVQIHCYRADEMLQMIDLSHEFGFKITAFHHALEAFKIAKVLAREGIGVVTWSGDWAGYKMEAYDSIMETPAFVEQAGGLVSMHSDNVELMQHLNQEAGRSMTAAKEAGFKITDEQAIRWITINPAKIIGVADRTGSIEVGKLADIIVWDTYPFSVYSLPDLVFIDGALRYDRASPPVQPRSDYELGNVVRQQPRAFPVPSWESEK